MPEETYTSMDDYNNKKLTKGQLASFWTNNIEAADRVYTQWAQRFQVAALYQYYEGYQWLADTDWSNRPYVVNMVYTQIQTKLPDLLFDNPEFSLRPQPIGTEFDLDSAMVDTQTKEDVLNFLSRRKELHLSESHELAILDAFFGFGILHIGYADDLCENPQLNLTKHNNPLNNIFCKHIPFDHFRVSAQANWNLTEGKWYGYYEFVPSARLKDYAVQLDLDKVSPISDDSEAAQLAMAGKITIGENSQDIAPQGTVKIWHIWDCERKKYLKLALDAAKSSDSKILDYEDFEHDGICTLRFDKRRKGWYPMPPVFQWLSPQDEINDIRQTHRIHRKRYSRKYAMLESGIEQEEVDKFLYGPDGTVFKVKRPDALTPVQDAPLDTSNQQSLVLSYDDFLRVSGGQTEQGRIADRTTATQASINNQLAKIRGSRDQSIVGDFMVQVGYSVLRAVGKTKGDFWAEINTNNEGIMKEMQSVRASWKKIPAALFKEDDYTIEAKLTSISPIYQQEDKRNFMEFLAIITQYEILAFSPELLREAAYRCGYKNQSVLNQFMQLAQLAAIGRQQQLKSQVQQINSPTPTGPGQLPQQQADASLPPDNQEIMNTIFNRQGVQPQ